MRKISGLILVFFVCAAHLLAAGGPVKMNMGTYNIRLQTSADSAARSWVNRKADVARVIKQYDFDVFGVQEVGNKNQEEDLKALIPVYTYFGKGRDNQAGTKGEQIGIFFKTNRFGLKGKGSFFLSETPDTISKGWDAAFRRMCVWVKLYDSLNRRDFYVFCTHFDHMGAKARVESAKLIVERVKSIAADSPVLFVGDLNVSPDATEMYKTLNTAFDDSREISKKRPTGSVGTFNGYNVSKTLFPVSERIDYIFCKKFNVLDYRVITNKFSDETYPSDHFPIMIECVINY
jgi:endonuclease/exonuclease/phosphatase family metal-dependent hydrolase